MAWGFVSQEKVSGMRAKHNCSLMTSDGTCIHHRRWIVSAKLLNRSQSRKNTTLTADAVVRGHFFPSPYLPDTSNIFLLLLLSRLILSQPIVTVIGEPCVCVLR